MQKIVCLTRILGPLQFDLEFGFLSGTRGILNNEISKVIVCDGWRSKYKYCLIDTELMDIEKIVSTVLCWSCDVVLGDGLSKHARDCQILDQLDLRPTNIYRNKNSNIISDLI